MPALAEAKGGVVNFHPSEVMIYKQRYRVIEIATMDLVIRLHKEIGRGLALLVAGKDWKMPNASRATVLHPAWSFDRKNRYLTRGYKDSSLFASFLASTAALLVETWPRLRQCEYKKCPKIFYPVRRQIYRSKECCQREMWRRSNTKKPERDYHEEYKKRVRREKNNPKLKPATRPRFKAK